MQGQVGSLLASPGDYGVDATGRVTLATSVGPEEEVRVIYLGSAIQPAGLRLQATYVSLIAPSADNGLLGQVALADFTVRSPDTAALRVVSLTDFREELADETRAALAASAPGSGPQTANTASTQLRDQGRKSVFFDEGHYRNQDVAARSLLLFYQGLIDALEDVLACIDGRVVGAQDGRFRFNGLLNNAVAPSVTAALNQVDDLIQATPQLTLPAYSAQRGSRFFPTVRRVFGTTTAGSSDGDPVFDTGYRNVSKISSLRTRLPWAVVTEDALTSALSVTVDAAEGAAPQLRPGFADGMKVVIQAPDGTFLVTEGSPEIIDAGGVAPTQLTFTAGLPTDIPAGSTVYRSPADDSAASPKVRVYQAERDYDFDNDLGQVLYVVSYPPFDGSVPLVPAPLVATPIPAGEPLSANLVVPYPLLAPAAPPALYGGQTDDDGETPFPILGPTFTCEQNAYGLGYDVTESALLAAALAATTPQGTETVNISGSGLLLTRASGVWAAPLPRVGDLVRVLSGGNSSTSYRKITSVGASTVGIDAAHALTGPEAGVSVTMTRDAHVASTANLAASALFDAGGAFTQGMVGWTVVALSGPNTGLRRQVVGVSGATDLTYDPPFPTEPQVGVSYRLSNAAATYGGAGSITDAYGTLFSDLDNLLDDERLAFLALFNAVFTFLALVGDGVVALPSTISSAGTDFLAAGVTAGAYVYIQTGPNRGIYPVTLVTQHALTVGAGTSPSFTAPSVGEAFQVVTRFGVKEAALFLFFSLYAQCYDDLVGLETFALVWLTPTTVLGDADARATALLAADLPYRQAIAAARLASLSGVVSQIEAVLGGDGRLYDARYAWIDARINLSTGFVVRAARAVTDRATALETTRLQLLKILSLGTTT